MSALDTNVLVRYLVGDVPEQREAARELIDGFTPDEPGIHLSRGCPRGSLGAGAQLPTSPGNGLPTR